jgi:hypothetical protein
MLQRVVRVEISNLESLRSIISSLADANVADASALKFPTVSCRETTHLEQKGDLALPVSQFSFQAFFWL